MDLKELLGEELYEQVQEQVDEAEDDIELMVNDGSHVPRNRLNDKNEEIETLQEQIQALEDQISQRDQQLEQLKEDTQATEELQQKVEQFEQKNEQLKQEKEELLEQKQQEVLQEKKARALEVKLANAGAKHPNLLMKEADLDSLEFEDGEVKGVDDVMSNLQESYEDLFTTEKIKGKQPNQGGKTPEPQPNPDEMTDEEYIRARENGDLEI